MLLSLIFLLHAYCLPLMKTDLSNVGCGSSGVNVSADISGDNTQESTKKRSDCAGA